MSDPVTAGSLRGPLAFRRHLRAEAGGDDTVFLFCQNGVTAVRSAWIGAIAPLLDGTRDLDALVRARPAGMDPDDVAGLVDGLVDAGFVAARPPAAVDEDERALAYWDACGVDLHALGAARKPRVACVTLGSRAEGESVVDALSAAGLDLVDPCQADLTVVLCEDYLDPRLAELDAMHRRTGRPWLLARPVGPQVWIGPVLEPGRTACWHCLSHRLWGHRHAEACVQAVLGANGPASRPTSVVPPLGSAAANLVALEASKWLAGYRHPGQDSVWVLDTLRMHGELHELRRRPQCPECGDPSIVARRGWQPVVLRSALKESGTCHRTLTPWQMLDRYRHLISPVTGVVKEIGRDSRAPAFVNSFRSGLNVARGVTGLAGLREELRGENGGKGVSPLDAEVGALCEAVERFSANYQGDEMTVRGSLRSLGDNALHPNSTMLYSDRQYEERVRWNQRHAAFQHVTEPFDEDAEVDWTPLWSLTEQRHRLLPTGMLYFGVPEAVAGRSVRADSNGNAAGCSIEDAVLQGLLELVERDAVALWWYNRLRVPGVDLTAFGDPWVEEMPDQYARLGRELWALDLTTDLGVPVVVALSRVVGGPREDVLFGFGAHLDPRVALRRAVTELNQLLPAVLHGPPAFDDPDATAWMRNATVENQPYLWPASGHPPRRPADFAHVRRPDVRDDVLALVDVLRRHDLDTLVLDQTRPDIGMPVVKVVVPGLRHFWARFAPGRLFDVPVRMGLLDRPTAYEDLNPFPMFL
ncbi:TOMM precursor leader peptide-binding protein [Saccharothrix hoggarensis]|uniref:TOMM leader peptide-binding protein n=1 Tax=Saccharothrix hoggarensis TaxID=913853 RepID=A0ABW3R1Y8_9PSEU